MFLIHQNVTHLSKTFLGIWWFHRSKDFEDMKAQIQPKSQLLFHKNFPPQDFSL